jgi:hypothetical protein
VAFVLQAPKTNEAVEKISKRKKGKKEEEKEKQSKANRKQTGDFSPA